MLAVRSELYKEGTVTSSWYDIWAGAVAVRAMCVMQGRSGQVMDVGMFPLFSDPLTCPMATPLGWISVLSDRGGLLVLWTSH